MRVYAHSGSQTRSHAPHTRQTHAHAHARTHTSTGSRTRTQAHTHKHTQTPVDTLNTCLHLLLTPVYTLCLHLFTRTVYTCLHPLFTPVYTHCLHLGRFTMRDRMLSCVRSGPFFGFACLTSWSVNLTSWSVKTVKRNGQKKQLVKTCGPSFGVACLTSWSVILTSLSF
jgi:hypothetical protein